MNPESINWLVSFAAQEVYKEMGPGHTETVYEEAMYIELCWLSRISYLVSRQVPCPLKYKGFPVGVGFIDLLIGTDFIVELKSVAKLAPKDEYQVRKYLVALDLDNGLLINFGNNLEIVEVQKGEYEQTPSSED